MGQILDMPSDKAMKRGIRLIEHTNPDAVGAIALVPHPELKAFFRIDIPFINPVVIGYCESLLGGFVKTDGFSRAYLGTLSADFAHLSDADFNGLVRYQRQIREHLANPHPWS